MSFQAFNPYMFNRKKLLMKNKYHNRKRSRKIYHSPVNLPIIYNINDLIIKSNYLNSPYHYTPSYDYNGRSIYDRNDTFKHILNDKSQPSTIFSFMKNENI